MTEKLFPETRLETVTEHFQKMAKKYEKIYGESYFYDIRATGEIMEISSGRKWINPETKKLEEYTYKFKEYRVTFDDTIISREHEFVGLIDHNELPAKIVCFDDNARSLIDEKINKRFKCEGCNSTRYRTRTFVTRKGGKYYFWGSDCIKEALGINPSFFITYWAKLAPMFESYDSDEGSWGVETYNVDEFIMFAGMSTIDHGYKKTDEPYSTKDFAQSTADFVKYPPKRSDEFNEWMCRVDELMVRAKKINIKACKEYWSKEDNQFGRDMMRMMDEREVTAGNLGILAYSYAGYLRSIEKNKEKEDKPESNYLGEVKERITFRVADLNKFEIRNEWGDDSYYLVTLVTPEGNVVKTFTSGKVVDLHYDYANGEVDLDTFEFRGTVKRHSEYKGVKETIVGRLSFKQVEMA